MLDFIHADEKLWDVANSLFGETAPQRTPWVESQTLDLLAGRVPQVITELRRLANPAEATTSQQTVLTQVANYFERNTPYMHYDQYLANGWPIASGVIEGACRHLVKDRCELSGMRWTQDGVENLLRLRAVAENDDWSRLSTLLSATAPPAFVRRPAGPHKTHSKIKPWLTQNRRPSRRPLARAFIMPTVITQRAAQSQKRAA